MRGEFGRLGLKPRYSKSFREKLVSRMLGWSAASANSLAKEVGVHQSTLSRWLRGKQCGDSASIKVKAVNQCTDAIDVKICLNNRNKDGSWRWSCGGQSDVQPRERLNDGHWTCHSSGKVVFWARKAGDYSTQFPIVPSESPEP